MGKILRVFLVEYFLTGAHVCAGQRIVGPLDIAQLELSLALQLHDSCLHLRTYPRPLRTERSFREFRPEAPCIAPAESGMPWQRVVPLQR